MENSERLHRKADRIRSLVLSYELSDDDPSLQEEIGQLLHRAITNLTANNGALTPEELYWVRNGKKIAAIKSVRSRTGWGVKEAKNHVEKFM
jgi:hypothetical protein